MTENPPDTKKWVIGTTIVLVINGYELTLMGIKDSDTGLIKFSGEVDFFDNPISIKHLVDRFLSNFNLTLPDSVPDITFNSFGGATVLKPDDKKYYRFYANSKLTLPNPFGLSNSAINFDNLKLALNRSVKVLPPPPPGSGDTGTDTPIKEEWDTSVSVTSDISYTPGGTNPSSINFGSGNFYFVSGGNYALSLFITQEIDPAGIIENLLSITIPSEVKTFLPTFKPEAADKPIRLYKSSADFTFQDVNEDGTLSPIPFSEGFNLDQLDIGIFNTNFLVKISIVGDVFSITAHSESINLFGLVEVIKKSDDSSSATGPGLEVVSKPKSIKLFGGLKFFPDSADAETLDVEFGYLSATSEFTGDITYDGTIAGKRNPELGFAWKKEGEFRITKFPFDEDALSKAMDWGAKIKKFANSSQGGCEKACGELADLAFNELITTTYDLKFTPESSTKPGYVKIAVEGTYKISAVGKSVSNITFNKIYIEFKIPTSFDNLAQSILDSLIASSETIAKGLWDNKAQITEFFTFITIKNVTKNQACRLACKVGKDVLKKAFEDLLKSAVGDALATAAEAVAAAVGVLAAIASAVSWLVHALSGKKSKAETQKEENTNKIEIELLAINGFSAAYHQADGNNKYIEVNWHDIPGGDAGGGEVYYQLNWSTDSRRINRSSPGGTYTEKITKPRFKNGVAVLVSVTAHFNYNGRSYATRNPGRKTVNTPILQTPLPIPKKIDLKSLWTTAEQKKLGIIKTSWNAVHVTPSLPLNPVSCSEYKVALWNTTTNKIIAQETISASKMPLGTTFELYKDTVPITPVAERFMPNPTHLFQIKINAIATDPDLNSLTGTSDKFNIPWGTGYVRIGYNFKID